MPKYRIEFSTILDATVEVEAPNANMAEDTAYDTLEEYLSTITGDGLAVWASVSLDGALVHAVRLSSKREGGEGADTY